MAEANSQRLNRQSIERLEQRQAEEPPADVQIPAPGTFPIGKVHAIPPEGSGLMPCCGLTPFEADRGDQMTAEPTLITCPGPACGCPGEQER